MVTTMAEASREPQSQTNLEIIIAGLAFQVAPARNIDFAAPWIRRTPAGIRI